jgi:cell division control protein 6
MCIVVLDELDQLLSRQQSVLYHLFELASAHGSRLILIGVANALDLSDRFLPRLAALGATPRTVTFSPYSPAELESIISQRIAPVEASATSCLMERSAIKLCAMKVAAASGDARRALEVCRVAADRAILELQSYEDLLPIVEPPQLHQNIPKQQQAHQREPQLLYSARPSMIPRGKSPLSTLASLRQ